MSIEDLTKRIDRIENRLDRFEGKMDILVEARASLKGAIYTFYSTIGLASMLLMGLIYSANQWKINTDSDNDQLHQQIYAIDNRVIKLEAGIEKKSELQ